MESTSLTSAVCWGKLEAKVDKAMTVQGLEGGPPPHLQPSGGHEPSTQNHCRMRAIEGTSVSMGGGDLGQGQGAQSRLLGSWGLKAGRPHSALN